jgi:hypothetical protein
MLHLLPDAFERLMGSSEVAEHCEILMVEHIEQIEGRMVTGSEFWEGFLWKIDQEYNASHRPLKGRAWFYWRDEPIVRLDYDLEPKAGESGFEFGACRPKASRTKYHASQDLD